jgi:polysaccharide transporter, PST family
VGPRDSAVRNRLTGNNTKIMQDNTPPVENSALAEEAARPLRRGVARAALASGAGEAATRVLTIVLSIATARALLPSQVGILGIAVIVVGIISLVAACSETAGIISRSEGTDVQHAFAATAVRGFIVVILVTAAYIGLPMITRLLGSAEDSQTELIGLFRVLLWLPVVELAASYPRVLLQRRLDLTYLSGVGFFQVTFHVGLSVILLWLGYGAIGIVWSSIIAGALSALAVWLRISGSRWPEWVGLPDSTQRLAALINTSKIFAGSFLGYLNGRADNLLVAGALGPTAMGFYGMAWSASRVAPQILGQAFGFVLVPALARIQTDENRVNRALRESLRHSYVLLAPLSAALFVFAPAIVTIVLGAKWLPMIPCLRVMSITILAAPLVGASNAMLVAAGRAQIAGFATLGQLAVLAMTIPLLSRRWGMVGAAFGDLIAVTVLTGVLLVVAPQIRRLLKGALPAILPPPVAAVASGAVVWLFTSGASGGLFLLAAHLLVLGCVYLAGLSLLGGRAAIIDLVGLMRTVAQRIPAV